MSEKFTAGPWKMRNGRAAVIEKVSASAVYGKLRHDGIWHPNQNWNLNGKFLLNGNRDSEYDLISRIGENCKCNVGDDGGFNLCRECELKIEDKRKEPVENKNVYPRVTLVAGLWYDSPIYKGEYVQFIGSDGRGRNIDHIFYYSHGVEQMCLSTDDLCKIKGPYQIHNGDTVRTRRMTDQCWDKFTAAKELVGCNHNFKDGTIEFKYKEESWIDKSCLILVKRLGDQDIPKAEEVTAIQEKKTELILGDYVEVVNMPGWLSHEGERGYIKRLINLHDGEHMVHLVFLDGPHSHTIIVVYTKYLKLIERRGIIPDWLPSNLVTHHWAKPEPLLWPNVKQISTPKIECACCHGRGKVLAYIDTASCKSLELCIDCPECSTAHK